MNSQDPILLIPSLGADTSSAPTLFGADSPVPGATLTMWAMAALIAAMAVGIAILALIIRDAMDDEAGWLHWAGGIVTWIGLAICFEGLQALARSPAAQDGTQQGADADLWIAVGLRLIFYAAIPTLTLLAFALGKDLWRDRQDKKAEEKARQLRGTSTRR